MKNLSKMILGSAASVAFLCACSGSQQTAPELTASGLNPADFDTCIAVAYDYATSTFVADSANAKQVKLYTIKNANGMEVCITNFGGRIVSIMVPNKDGKLVDVACGFDKVENYFPWNFTTDYGCSVGRYANRIDGGQYILDGDTVTLDKNNNDHACLHGGFTGWQYQVYDVAESTENSLTLKMVSAEGDNKFPGNLTATVKFELTENNEIAISYDATSDKPTVINMTNHTYFNLSGDLNNTVDESILYVNADAFTPGDDFLIPTGEIKSVEGTVFDFRTPKAIGQDMNSDDDQLVKAGGGYDHNWCLNTKGDENTIAVTLSDPRSGIKMDVYTNEPGIQCYSANFQDGTCTGKGGVVYQKHCAICLETQKYPDSPNKYTMEGWELSNPFVTPEKPYHSYCKYSFSVEK